MIDWNTCSSVELTPELVSEAWVFRGTRVPGVDLTHAFSVLEHAAKSAIVVH